MYLWAPPSHPLVCCPSLPFTPLPLSPPSPLSHSLPAAPASPPFFPPPPPPPPPCPGLPLPDAEDDEVVLMKMSTLNEEGVMEVKQVACERLLNYRVEMKVAGKRIGDVLNRIHVAMPKPRDTVSRPPVIPPGVEAARAKRALGDKRRTEKDMQVRGGGGGGGLCVDLSACRHVFCVGGDHGSACMRVSVCLSVCPSVRLSVCLSVCLSLCL